MASVYDELLGELEELAKALPTTDEADEAEEHAEPDGDEEGVGGDDDGDEPVAKDKAPMAKSMSVTLADGSEAEAVDAEELIKSLQSRIDATTEGVGQVLAKQAELIKSLTGTVESLRNDVASLRNEGRGRKAVVTMTGVEEPMTKSMSTPGDILAKCLDAQKSGRLTALDVSVAEGYLNRGMPVPDRIASLLS